MKSLASRNNKIASLLGLSAGALGSTQIAEAQIVYSGVLNEKIGFSSGFGVSYTLDLPGTADLQLVRSSQAVNPYNGFKQVDFKQLNGYARVKGSISGTEVFAARIDAGATWNTIGAMAAQTARMERRTTAVPVGSAPSVVTVTGPGQFNNQYVAFVFQDSTSSEALRYGWAKFSTEISTTSGPDVTLLGWAYDASGETIAMGATTPAIPEPATSAALIAFGALAFGGVRRWRASKKKHATAVAG